MITFIQITFSDQISVLLIDETHKVVNWGGGGDKFLINLGIKEEIIMEIRMYLELNDFKKVIHIPILEGCS